MSDNARQFRVISKGGRVMCSGSADECANYAREQAMNGHSYKVVSVRSDRETKLIASADPREWKDALDVLLSAGYAGWSGVVKSAIKSQKPTVNQCKWIVTEAAKIKAVA